MKNKFFCILVIMFLLLSLPITALSQSYTNKLDRGSGDDQQVGHKVEDVLIFNHSLGGIYTRQEGLIRVEDKSFLSGAIDVAVSTWIDSSLMIFSEDIDFFESLNFPHTGDTINNYVERSNLNKSKDFDDIIGLIDTGEFYRGLDSTQTYQNSNSEPSGYQLNDSDRASIRKFFNKDISSSTLKYFDYDIKRQSIHNPIAMKSQYVTSISSVTPGEIIETNNIDTYDFDLLFEKIYNDNDDNIKIVSPYLYKNVSDILPQTVMLRELFLKGEFLHDGRDPDNIMTGLPGLINGADGSGEEQSEFKLAGTEYEALAIAHSQGGTRTVAYAIDQRLNRSLRYYAGRDMGIWPNYSNLPSPYNGDITSRSTYLESEHGSTRWDLAPTIKGIITAGSPLAGGGPIAAYKQFDEARNLVLGAILPFLVSLCLSELGNSVGFCLGLPGTKLAYIGVDVAWGLLSNIWAQGPYSNDPSFFNVLASMAGMSSQRFTVTAFIVFGAVVGFVSIIKLLASLIVGDDSPEEYMRGNNDLLPDSQFMQEYFNGELSAWSFDLTIDPAQYVKIPVSDENGEVIGYAWAQKNTEPNSLPEPEPYIPEFVLNDDIANSLVEITEGTNDAMGYINDIQDIITRIYTEANNLSKNVFMLSQKEVGFAFSDSPASNLMVLDYIYKKIKKYFNTIIVLPKRKTGDDWDAVMEAYRANPEIIPIARYVGSDYETLLDCPVTNISDGGTENRIGVDDFVITYDPDLLPNNEVNTTFDHFTNERGISVGDYGTVGSWAYGERLDSANSRAIHQKIIYDYEYNIFNLHNNIESYSNLVSEKIGNESTLGEANLYTIVNRVSDSFQDVQNVLTAINQDLENGELSFNIDALVEFRNYLVGTDGYTGDQVPLTIQLQEMKADFESLYESWTQATEDFSDLKNTAYELLHKDIKPVYFGDVKMDNVTDIYNILYTNEITPIYPDVLDIKFQLKSIYDNFDSTMDPIKFSLEELLGDIPDSDQTTLDELKITLEEFHDQLLGGSGDGETDAGINLDNMTFTKPLSDVYYASITGGRCDPGNLIGAHFSDNIKFFLVKWSAGAFVNSALHIVALGFQSFILGLPLPGLNASLVYPWDLIFMSIEGMLWLLTGGIGMGGYTLFSSIPDKWNTNFVGSLNGGPSDGVIAVETAAGSNQYPADKVGGIPITDENSLPEDGITFQDSHFHFPDAVHGGPVYTSTLLSRKESSARIAWLTKEYIKRRKDERNGVNP